MRVLFIGDIVGESGRRVVTQNLTRIRDRYKLDFVIANGENSASGFGITEKILHSLIDSGIDVITSGNHIWDQKDTLIYIDRETRLLRPANYPKGTPGKGSFLYKVKNGEQIMVINLMGRVFMNPLDDPFRIIDDIIDNNGLNNAVDVIFVDFHAEFVCRIHCPHPLQPLPRPNGIAMYPRERRIDITASVMRVDKVEGF